MQDAGEMKTDLSHDGDGFRGEEPRIPDIVIDYGVKHLLLIFPRERRLKEREGIIVEVLTF